MLCSGCLGCVPAQCGFGEAQEAGGTSRTPPCVPAIHRAASHYPSPALGLAQLPWQLLPALGSPGVSFMTLFLLSRGSGRAGPSMPRCGRCGACPPGPPCPPDVLQLDAPSQLCLGCLRGDAAALSQMQMCCPCSQVWDAVGTGGCAGAGPCHPQAALSWKGFPEAEPSSVAGRAPATHSDSPTVPSLSGCSHSSRSLIPSPWAVARAGTSVPYDRVPPPPASLSPHCHRTGTASTQRDVAPAASVGR